MSNSNSESELYFSYGSNLRLDQIRKVCPTASVLSVAKLKGYRLAFSIESEFWVWKGGVADIVKDVASEVWGLVYQISRDDLKALDEYEASPEVYNRISVNVDRREGDVLSNVWTYEVVSKSKRASFITPSESYLDILKQAAEEYNFPWEYRNMLSKIPTLRS